MAAMNESKTTRFGAALLIHRPQENL